MRTELKSRIGPLRASSYRDAIFGVPTTPETRRASARPPVHRPSSLRHPSSPSSSSSWSFRNLLLFLLFLLLLPITPGSPHLPSAIFFNSFVSLSSWPLLLPKLDAVCRVQLFYDTPVCSFSPSPFLSLPHSRALSLFSEFLRASTSFLVLLSSRRFSGVRFSSPDLLVASRSSRRFPLLVLHRLPFTSISGGSCRALRFMREERNRSTPEYTANSDFAECPGFFDRRGKAGGKFRRTLR